MPTEARTGLGHCVPPPTACQFTGVSRVPALRGGAWLFPHARAAVPRARYPGRARTRFTASCGAPEAARPQRKTRSSPKLRPAVTLSTSVTQADFREAMGASSLPQEMDRYQRIDKIEEGLMTTFYPSQPSIALIGTYGVVYKATDKVAAERFQSVSINFRFKITVNCSTEENSSRGRRRGIPF